MKIIYSRKFAKQYRKLPLSVQLKAEQLESKFRVNIFDPVLRTHKLTGVLKGFWSFSIGYNYRIIFERRKSSVIYFHTVGKHDIYK